jgi:hypothetical protein
MGNSGSSLNPSSVVETQVKISDLSISIGILVKEIEAHVHTFHPHSAHGLTKDFYLEKQY